MKAHLDYWDDNEVIEAVRGSWHQKLPPPQTPTESNPKNPVRHAPLFDQLHNLAQAILTICAVGGVVFAIANALAVVHERRAVAAEFLARVASRGVETQAKVTHSTTYWGYGKDLTFPVQVYEFEFKGQNKESRRIVFRENESSSFDGGLYFDSAALRKRLGREEESRNKVTLDVPILYLEDDRDHLTLADPRLRPSQSGFPIFEALYTGVGPILFMVMIFQVLLYYACCGVAEAILPPAHFRR
jgi:hypothetical protein